MDVDQLKQSITTFLVETLGIDRAELEESYTKSGRYYVLKTQVEKDVADEITTYFDKLSCPLSARRRPHGVLSPE